VVSTGLIDLHSHLLPGVDDGCRSLEESLACVRELIVHGFAGTVCTPHMDVAAFPKNTPTEVTKRVAALQLGLTEAGMEYRLWSGGELRISADTVAWLREHGVPTLGPGRAVLVDYWGREWPPYADAVLEYLLADGYEPILAHPERMDLPDGEWDAVLDRVQQQTVVLQGNLRCIAGREGPRVGARALRLLTHDRYHLVATDMHGPTDLADRLAGLNVAEQLVGKAKLKELISEVPQEIISW
jgi:protein-tyrosine phosphatase